MLVVTAVTTSAAADEATLRAGPMIGDLAAESAQVWLQADSAATAFVRYWPKGELPRSRASDPLPLRSDADYAGKIRLTGLRPDTNYRYRVFLDGAVVDTGDELALRTPPDPRANDDTRADLTVLAGSCALVRPLALLAPYGPARHQYSIYETMAEQRPDITLWLGDNLYFQHADLEKEKHMAARYRAYRGFPRLQTLLRTGTHYAVWDDHDYGPNNSDRHFARKAHSLELFRRYWPNPSFGTADTPGIFTRFRRGDVEFFLLDNRYHRDPPARESGMFANMLGWDQLAWLREGLADSQARFKVIVSGSRMLQDVRRGEGWSQYPMERGGFLHWLERERIEGVVFLTGDPHYSQLLRLERPGHYPLYDLTCSPLTSPARYWPDITPRQVGGTRVTQRNFCRLGFGSRNEERALRLSAHDTDGKQLWRHDIPIRELTYSD